MNVLTVQGPMQLQYIFNCKDIMQDHACTFLLMFMTSTPLTPCWHYPKFIVMLHCFAFANHMHLHPQHATDCIQGHVWGSHHIPCCSYVSLATPCFEELCPHVQCILLGVLARFELGSNVLDQFPMIGTHLLRNLHNQMFFFQMHQIFL